MFCFISKGIFIVPTWYVFIIVFICMFLCIDNIKAYPLVL